MASADEKKLKIMIFLWVNCVCLEKIFYICVEFQNGIYYLKKYIN